MFTQSVAHCVTFVNRRLCFRLSFVLSTFVFIVLSYRRLSLSFDPLLASRQGSTCVYLFTIVTCTCCFNVTISHTFRGLMVFCIKSAEQYFSYRVRFRVIVFNTTFNSISAILKISFIGGGNQSTRRKPLTCRKSLANFITVLYRVHLTMSGFRTHNFRGYMH